MSLSIILTSSRVASCEFFAVVYASSPLGKPFDMSTIPDVRRQFSPLANEVGYVNNKTDPSQKEAKYVSR